MAEQQPDRAKKYLLDQMGGINTGADPTDIADNEFVSLQNWYPYAGRLIRRGGTDRVSAEITPFSEEMTSAFAYKTSTGTWTLIVGGVTNLGKLVGTELVQLPQFSPVFASSDRHYSFVQYKDIVYAARVDIGNLQRTDAQVVGDAGIDAPATAPTFADGGAGNMVAGEYIGVVTFYNTFTAAESDPSDPSNTLTQGANKHIHWTAIPVSTNPQTNARRLYRTLNDQEGEYYFVGEIGDNVSTTYDDNAIQSELGVQCSFENGLPPANLQLLETFGERLWATDGIDLFFSGIAMPESFYALDYLQITPDDGHKISGLLNFGDRLMVGKTNGVHYLSSPDQVQTLTDRHGVYAHHSFKAAEGYAFWFGGDNFYQTDGNVVRAIGDVKIRTLIDDIWTDNYHKIISVIDSKQSRYITLIPSGWSDLNMAVVYNYKDETWTVFKWTSKTGVTSIAPGFITDFYDANGKHVIYGNLREELDDIFEFLTDSGTDNGQNIECFLYTKFFGGENAQTLKYMRRVSVQATVVPENLTATLFGDNAVTLKGPVDVYMYPGRNWKRFPLSNNGLPAAALQLYLEYTASPTLEILGIGFDLVDTGREVPISETL